MNRTRRWAGLAFSLTLLAAWAWAAPAPEPGEKDPRYPQQIEEARRDLRSLQKLAEDPKPDLEELWMTWQRFRTAYAGTPEWVQACAIMAKAPSPLDKLDRAQIPEEDRFDWQPPGLVAVLGEHRARAWGPIDGLAVSPDGQTIATTGGGLWLWDAATQRDKVVLVDRHGWGVPVFSPDGQTLAAQSGTDVCFWDLTGARPRKRMSFKANPGFGIDHGSKETDATRHIFLVGDGKTLIAGGDYEHRWWDVSGDEPKEQGKLALNLRLSTEGEELHFTSDGHTAVGVAGGVNQFRVFDWADGKLKARAAIPDAADMRTAFSADDHTLAMLVNGGEVLLWDLTTEKPSPKLKSDGMKCNGLVDLGFAPRRAHLD